MDGWIIKNKKGQYLVKSRQWRPSKSSEALFFSEQDIEDLRDRAESAGIDTSILTLLPARFEEGKIRSRNGSARTL